MTDADGRHPPLPAAVNDRERPLQVVAHRTGQRAVRLAADGDGARGQLRARQTLGRGRRRGEEKFRSFEQTVQGGLFLGEDRQISRALGTFDVGEFGNDRGDGVTRPRQAVGQSPGVIAPGDQKGLRGVRQYFQQPVGHGLVPGLGLMVKTVRVRQNRRSGRPLRRQRGPFFRRQREVGEFFFQGQPFGLLPKPAFRGRGQEPLGDLFLPRPQILEQRFGVDPMGVQDVAQVSGEGRGARQGHPGFLTQALEGKIEIRGAQLARPIGHPLGHQPRRVPGRERPPETFQHPAPLGLHAGEIDGVLHRQRVQEVRQGGVAAPGQGRQGAGEGPQARRAPVIGAGPAVEIQESPVPCFGFFLLERGAGPAQPLLFGGQSRVGRR
jgi:hypothetical protein